MSRRPIPPVIPRTPPPPGLWRATPPAIFPPILGLLGLGLAWRRASDVLALPADVAGLAEAFLGAVALLFLFALLTYAAKVLRRRAVVMEDLRILPGRAGVAALGVCLLLLAAVVVPYSPSAGGAMLIGALLLHAVIAALTALVLWRSPAEGRVVTPVWHLAFVGAIVGGIAAEGLGWQGLSRALLYATAPVALAIWGVSLWQLIRRIPPAPLRPVLAIHLAPASLFATVAAGIGAEAVALVALGLAVGIVVALSATARWITAAGFSPLWAAFTFPSAVFASALFANGFAAIGSAVLALVSLMVPVIAFRVLRDWARGDLGPRTNAAVA